MKKITKDKIKTWFVTGASSGVGLEMCNQLLKRGYNVVAVARRVPQIDGENVLCLSVDVTKPQTIKEAIEKAKECFGRIDVLVNNAGISANITLEEENLEHMKKVIETNFFGTFNLLNEFIPFFRENKNGTIINNTSQSGISARAFGSAYVSSKHAIEGLTSVCWHETRDFCRVMAFELGFFNGTEILSKMEKKKTEIQEYKKIPAFYFEYKRNFENDLSIAVKHIIDQVEKEKLPRRLMLGKDALIQIGVEVLYLIIDYIKSIRRALSCAKSKKK